MSIKFKKWIIILLFIYVTIIVGLIYVDLIEAHTITYIVIGLLTALISWLATHGLTHWLDRDEKERIYRKVHKIDEVLNLLRGRSLSMVRKNRKDLPDEYFLDIFKNAELVKISGIANTAFIHSILDDEKHPLIMSLKRNKGVTVEVLLCHPESSYIRDTRDKKEEEKTGRSSPASSDILTSINNLCKLQKKHSTEKLSKNSRMIIRLSNHPINVSITYVKVEEVNPRQTFLVGFLIHHDLGNNLPIYDIQESTESSDIGEFRKVCLKNFDELFKDSRENKILTWNEEGCFFDESCLTEKPVDCGGKYTTLGAINDEGKSVITRQ
uniref:Uncharacterized protein n=1 Tax=Candidatus Kentrum sp. LFY TaxID=2126342 RepID=A0A450WQ57_9GAMM|nr:MAG: hypothetical protein BECKLFY1418C_GA0070996_105323 [Candidatus Kentron sp. LFY]